MPGSSHPPVHVVVLAAGRGSRLGARGDRPKWLLEVGGRTLADRQLEGIAAAGSAVASVRVVTGHAAEVIAQEVPGVGLVHNPEFAEINNWWSLLRALRELPEDGPVAVINADLLAEPATVAAFLGEAGAYRAVLAVDLERELTDESMKVARGGDGTLRLIGKVGVDDPAGEYVGMLAAQGPALRHLRETLEGFVGRDECANEWYEGAVGRTAAAGTPWEIWPMPSGGWVEIDDHGDLELAEALAAAR